MRTEVPTYEPDTRREDDDARQQRWDEFVENMRGALAQLTLPMLLHDVGIANASVVQPNFLQAICQDFAETEGWSGVLSAVAQAMRERERFHRECFDRR
jgi:hypothetical protein